jgi:hypothetical protein
MVKHRMKKGEMQYIQNLSAKLVLNRKKFDKSRELLCHLHWLLINSRIKPKLKQKSMYNCYVGEAPLYYLPEHLRGNELSSNPPNPSKKIADPDQIDII